MELLVVVALFVGGIAAATWTTRRLNRDIDNAWQRVAGRRGGRFSSVDGPELDVRADGLAIHFDQFTVSAGRTFSTYTRARAPYLLGSGPRFLVQGEQLHQVESFGFESFELDTTLDLVLGGNPEFDKKFEVCCNHLEATRQAWPASARTIMVEEFASGGASSDGDVVSLLCHGAVTTVATLEKMIAVVVDVASCGRMYLSAAASLRDARWLQPTGTWIDRTPLAVAVPRPQGAAVQITSELATEQWQLRASLPCDRAIELFWSSLSSGGDIEPASPEEVLDDTVADSWRAFGASKLAFDGDTLSLRWPASERDEARIPAAIAILSVIAKPSHGVYR